MKNRKPASLLLIVLCAALVFSACGTVKNVSGTLTFMVDGQKYDTVSFDAGTTSVSLPDDPTKDGYVFGGWYYDEGSWLKPLSVSSLLDTSLSNSVELTVYARWLTPEEAANGTVNGTVIDYGKCGDNLTWAFYDNGTLSITGAGAMYDYEDTNAPWLYLESRVTKVIVGEGVTSICRSAFDNCTAVTEISIASTVTSIGKRAFQGFDSLKSFVLGKNITYLGECVFANREFTVYYEGTEADFAKIDSGEGDLDTLRAEYEALIASIQDGTYGDWATWYQEETSDWYEREIANDEAWYQEELENDAKWYQEELANDENWYQEQLAEIERWYQEELNGRGDGDHNITEQEGAEGTDEESGDAANSGLTDEQKQQLDQEKEDRLNQVENEYQERLASRPQEYEERLAQRKQEYEDQLAERLEEYNRRVEEKTEELEQWKQEMLDSEELGTFESWLTHQDGSWRNAFLGELLYYSETSQSGCWHYVNGVPTAW